MNLINKLLLFSCLLLLSNATLAQVSFTPSNLAGVTVGTPTSLQFGPDGRLYVSERYGIIKAFTIVKDSTNSYSVTNVEIIDNVKDIKNHNDDGTLATNIQNRQITGLFIAGTSTNPIIYVTSSDPRDNAGGGTDTGLDTNSGIVTRLTWNGSTWVHVDLVRGIGRSEENHSINGLLLDSTNNMMYVCVGGITNMGSPSINFGLTPEYATTAAILSIDMTAIEAMPILSDSTGIMPDYIYDIPTLDDEDRPGPVDANDPFGGNDGKNQAMLVAGGPVQIFTSGLRNPYDIVKTEAGNFFTFDNGPNKDWGGIPPIDTVTGKCINVPNDTINSFTHCDQLHHIPSAGFYAGFSNPTRSNRENTFNDTIFYNGGLDTILPQSPIAPGLEDPSCEYRVSPKTNWCTQFPITNYPDDGALAVNYRSSNGMCEYTASNFNGALQGDLLVSDLGGIISHYDLDSTGINLEPNGQNVLLSNFGAWSLDVIAQGDNDIFPGTIWVCNFLSNSITVFDPDDIVSCDTTDLNADADNDGYSNGDEMANGSNPCSAGDQPSDFDEDNLSDLWDNDDDNDGINDVLDPFAQDSTNGVFTTLPVNYAFTNTNDGGIKDWGFTGLMTDSRDYMVKYDLAYMTVGGAALKFTVDSVTNGTATGASNNNDYAFQFGINVANETDNFTVKARAMSPFSGITGGNLVDQSIGMFIGTGDQDNYLKVVCHANSGSGGILVEKEELGVTSSTMHAEPILGSSYVDLFIIINPNNNTAQPAYAINGGAQTNIGLPISIPASWTDTVLAAGLITGAGPASPVVFAATWDFIEAYKGPLTNVGNWYDVPTINTPTARHENAFIEACGKFYLIGGRGVKPVQEYNPLDSTWTNKSSTPIQMHHFQAVELDGLIYIVGAFTNDFPNEVPIPNVYIYDPLSDTWTVGKEIPSGRRRGSAGAVLHDNKIYVVGGIVNGHISNTVDWFDVYDPYANTWDSLPSAPRIRDHFQVSIANNKMVVAGGRITSGSWPTVAEVDIYNFTSNLWSTLPSPAGDIPTQRGGCCAVTIGDEVIIIGGESTTQSAGYNETEALDVNTLTWRSLDTLNDGRHGTQATVSNGGIYICAGSGNAGGGPELNSLEAFYFNSITQPDSNSTTESILFSSPANVNFGQVLINNTQSSLVNITNTTGNQATIINSLSVIGDSEFTIDSTYGTPDVPFVLAPGQNVNIKVNYHPTVIGVNTAMLNIGTTGASSPYNVSLSGEGVDTLTSLYRINSGGPAYSANSGELFVADNFFVGGNQFAPGYMDTVDILNTLDDVLYRSEHNDSAFSYVFPVSNGAYEVKLHFAEIFWGAPNGGAGGAGDRLFNVNIEGNNVLNNYDIFVAAGGSITAIVETFVINVTDGELNIDFAATKDNAKVSAIEIQGTSLPLTYWYHDNDSDSYGNANVFLQDSIQPAGYVADSTDCDDNNSAINPAATEILDGVDNDCDGMVDEGLTAAKRINSGGPDYNSTAGYLFEADDYFVGGNAFTNFALDTVDIQNTTDDELYRSERTADTFAYAFPVLDTSFLVRLHFADIFWGATNGGGNGVPGERVFDVVIEGDTVLNDYDIIAETGGPEIAVIKDFIINTTDGEINIEFFASVDQAKVSAIEIIPDSTGTPCTLALSDSAINVSCNGLSDGAAYISVTGNQSPVTYAWSNSATSSSIANLSAGVYTVTVTENASCASVRAITINEPAPVQDSIFTNDPTTFCAGVGALLEAPNVPGYTYQWRRFGNPLSGETLSTVLAKQNGPYSCVITDMHGCSAISNNIVTTKLDRATAVINETGPVEFCGLTSTTLSAQTFSGYTYLWLRYGQPAIGQNTDSVYTTTKAGNYKVRVTAPNGCTATSTKTVLIKNIPPKAEIDQAGPIAACTGDSITLNGFSNRGTPPFTAYQWFKFSNPITGETNPSITVYNSGGYSVRITDSKGCEDKSPRTVVNFSGCGFNCNVPAITSITNLSATGADLGWSTASTAPAFEIRYAVSGSGSFLYDTVSTGYVYNITGLTPSTTYETAVRALCNPASAWSGSITFTTNALKFSSNNLSNNGMAVTAYPNPTNGSVNLIIESPLTKTKKGSIVISDLTGRVIRYSETKFYDGNNYLEFDLSDVKPGLYFININVDEYSERIKIIKN